MPDLKTTRAELLDELFKRHSEGMVSWNFDNETSSAQSHDIGGFQFHIDRKNVAGNVYYKVWIFDSKTNSDLDTFSSNDLKDLKPSLGDFGNYFALLNKIYQGVKETRIIEAISPALAKLKALTKS